MSVTLRFQNSGIVPGDGRPVAMRGGSLTAGRGPENDLVLPDPDRTLSKNHFVIEDHGGNVVVVDLSTNGTFLNYAKTPLGRTPTPLNDGDVLGAGGYEIVVDLGTVAEADLIAPPVAAAGVSHGRADAAPDPLALLDDSGPGGDFLDDLLGADPTPKGPGGLTIPDPMDDLLGPGADDLLGPAGDTQPSAAPGPAQAMHAPAVSDAFTPMPGGIAQIPDDWDDLLAPDPVAPPAAQPIPDTAPDPLPDPLTEPVAEPAPVPPSEPTVVPPQADDPPPPSQGTDAATLAFLDALGLVAADVPEADRVETMARLGRATRTLITGLREVLMTRATIKSEFRIDQTMIASGGNNPLKFSVSEEQAIEAMARPRVKGYLPADRAAEEALRDLKAHEVAMVTGIEAALRDLLERLGPEAIGGKIEDSGLLGGLFGNKKARYWDVYEKIHAEIAEQARDDFHALFAREFARAYKEQLGKLG